MDRYEDLYNDLLQDAVRESVRAVTRGNAQRSLENGASFAPRSSGTYELNPVTQRMEYRHGWRFGMKMGAAKLAR